MNAENKNQIETAAHGEFIANRAEIVSASRWLCDGCDEVITFAFEDSKGNKFSLGLTTILQCLYFAESHGELPLLPNDWTLAVKNQYTFRRQGSLI